MAGSVYHRPRSKAPAGFGLPEEVFFFEKKNQKTFAS